MNTTLKLTFDLVRQTEIIPPVCAVQGDTATRALEITLRANGAAWTPPDGTSFALAFRKPDGNRGVYDTLPDGTAAVSVAGNVVSIVLAPQVLTTAGNVVAMLLITDANAGRLSSFPFVISVAPDPSAGAPVSNHYYYFTSLDAINKAIGDMSQLETETKTDLVSAINEAFGGGAKGLTSEEKKVILSLFKAAAYTSDASAKVAELEALWSVSYKVSYSLTGATASNDTAAVVEGNAYNTTLTAEAGYSLTGATVKVTMGGQDITSTAYINGVINIAAVTGNVVITVAAREIPSFSITNNLTNVTNSNSATKVTEGDFYSATLSWDSAYSLNTIVITMGGVDVTADVYGEGNILITEVTGDIVITAEAGIPALYQLANTPVTCNAGLYEDTGLTFGSDSANGIKEAWTIVTTVSYAALSTVAAVANESFQDAFAIAYNYHQGKFNPAVYWGRGAWYHGTTELNKTHKLVITHEAGAYGAITVYSELIDGLSVTVTPTYNQLAHSCYAGNLFVGGRLEANFEGTIEDFTIYGAVLSEDEIKAYLGVA